MKRQFMHVLFLFIFLSVSLWAQEPKMWKQELDEEISDYEFLGDGKFLFLRSNEYVWLYDANSGTKVYNFKVKDYEKTGCHQLVGEQYIVGTDNKLQSYDALTGKLQWAQEYKKVSQDEFSDLTSMGSTTVLRFGRIHLGVDLKTGNELWRTEIRYNGDLKDAGTWNNTTFDKQGKLLVMMDDDMLGLFNYSDGKQIFSAKKYEVNSDILKKGYGWFYRSKNEQYALFCLDEHIAVVDITNNKEIARKEISYDSDFDPLLPTEKGCVVLGKKKIMYFSDSTASLLEIPASVGDFRTYQIMMVGEKEIFLAGLSDQMFAIDLIGGKLLWQTKKEDKNFEGYAHRYIKVDGTNILIAYGNAYVSNRGTSVHLMSLDGLTGKVNYKTPSLAFSEIAHPTWVRAATSFIQNLAGQKRTFGYENLGFPYSIDEFNGNLVFSFIALQKMVHPETKKNGGDGLCVVNPKTGEIIFKDYLPLVDYSYGDPQPTDPPLMKPFMSGNLLILIGDEGLAAYDLSVNKRIFYNKKEWKGTPSEAIVIDGTLYIKFGARKFKVILSPAKNIFDSMGMKVDDLYDEDPYGFTAFDCTTGKQLWYVKTEVDPGFLTPNFSLKNNYEPASKRLYFADEENIYALQFRPDGGKFDYKVNLDKIKIGEMPFKKTYAIQEWPIGSVSVGVSSVTSGGTTTTTVTTTENLGGAGYNRFISELEEADAYTTYSSWFTVWGAAAKKCLRAVYYDKNIFVAGNDGISLLNAADGKPIWVHPWEYDQDNVQYMPKILGTKLVYCVERQLTCVDLESGKTLWKIKEAKRPRFFISPNEKYMFSIDQEVIKGYQVQ